MVSHCRDLPWVSLSRSGMDRDEPSSKINDVNDDSERTKK